MTRVSFTPGPAPKLPEGKKLPEEINAIFERDKYFRVSVTGSQGNEYTIFVVRDLFLCSCPVGTYHLDKECRHVSILREYLGV